MKPFIQFIFCSVLWLHFPAAATNNDSISCLELSGKIRYQTPGTDTYKIELLEGNNIIRTLQAADDYFCFRLIKNTQYSIKIYEGSRTVKQIFVNTNLPWQENDKAYRFILAIDLPGNCASFEEEFKGSFGALNFDPKAGAFCYSDKHIIGGEECNDFDITKPKY